MDRIHDLNIYFNEDNRIVFGKMCQLEYCISANKNPLKDATKLLTDQHLLEEVQAYSSMNMLPAFVAALHGTISLGNSKTNFHNGFLHIIIHWQQIITDCKKHIPWCFQENPGFMSKEFRKLLED